MEGEAGPARRGFLGPFYAGHTINVSCVSRQGWPPPTLTWWSGSRMLKSSREMAAPGRVQNDLVIENISRSWHNRILTCTANNTQLTDPASASVQIHMLLLPSRVSISNPGPVVAGRQVLLRCLSIGSSPPPTLSWTINGTAIHGHVGVVEGAVTWSNLTINVSRAHHNVRVSCTATNPVFHGTSLSNTTTLNVHYPPSVSLSLGRSLQPESLREGDDVYFTCTVSANPPASPITWFHQGLAVLEHSTRSDDDVVVGGDWLVLRDVRRDQAGQYRCGASNPLARVVSAPVSLRIRLTSHPPVKAIQWQWKNNDGVISTPPIREQAESVTALLTVHPFPSSDHRTLTCFGANEMGTQVHPCKISIKEMRLPRMSCTVANISSNWLVLDCHPPRLSSLHNTLYIAEVYLENETLFANVTSSLPSFNVSRLNADTSYHIKVSFMHGPITSHPVLVSALTGSTAGTTPESSSEMGVRKIVSGLVSGVAVTMVVVGGTFWLRLCCIRRLTANKRMAALRHLSTEDTRPILHLGPSSEVPRERPSTLDFWHNEELVEERRVTVEVGKPGTGGPEEPGRGPRPGMDRGNVVATVEDIFRVVVNPRRQSAAMKKIEQEEEAPGENAAKEVDNYLGEWLQLFPKESEDTLTRKLQHVSKEDEEHVGEWLQQMPHDAHDYPGAWLVNADLQPFQKAGDSPAEGWLQKPSGDRAHTRRSPQGAEGYAEETLRHPRELAETYDDWRHKYRASLPEDYWRTTLRKPRRAREKVEKFQRWTMQHPATLPDRHHPLRILQYPSAVTGHPGRMPQLHGMPHNPARRASKPGGRIGEGMPLRKLEPENREMENEELNCSLQQLMFAEETIL